MKNTFTCLAGLILVVILLGGCNNIDRKPMIAITSVCKVDENSKEPQLIYTSIAYVNAVLENGGTPVVLPTIDDADSISQYVANFDGLIVIGGGDIPPEFYGQQPHTTVKVMTDQRFNFEKELIPAWFKSGKPMLGICLGHQFTNVCHGGTMTQDIPSQIGTDVIHRKKDEIAEHQIMIETESLLYDLLKKNKTIVNSLHHQAVNKLGTGLRVTAKSADGVIEATERTDTHFGLFLQWHPEKMPPQHRKAIFNAFIKACK